jgi:hypothetical protein
MSNGNGTKVWYKSKTIWLLIAQLLAVFAGVVSKDIGLTSAIAISMTSISGFIIRYYTDQGISLTKNGS